MSRTYLGAVKPSELAGKLISEMTVDELWELSGLLAPGLVALVDEIPEAES